MKIETTARPWHDSHNKKQQYVLFTRDLHIFFFSSTLVFQYPTPKPARRSMTQTTAEIRAVRLGRPPGVEKRTTRETKATATGIDRHTNTRTNPCLVTSKSTNNSSFRDFLHSSSQSRKVSSPSAFVFGSGVWRFVGLSGVSVVTGFGFEKKKHQTCDDYQQLQDNELSTT